METPDYNIEIDGFIGNNGYSKTYVAQKLNACKGKKANVRMNSMGGNLDHGLNISARFSEHGDVQCDLFGFNASSSTVATLGAKTVRMSAAGFYLIHKVSNEVFVLGMLNADEMKKVIDELTANIEENDKIDQVIAQMYADKTGKPVDEMLNLMKIGGWLNAEEAKQWGFIDEIIPNTNNEKTNFKGLEEKFNAFGLPTNRINTENLFTTKNNFEMKKQFDKVNAVIGVDKLESDKDGVFLNEAQIEKIDSRIGTLESKVDAVKTNLAKAKENLTASEAIVETQKTNIETKDATIAELNLQITNLKKGPGDKTNSSTKETDDDGGSDDKDEVFNTIKSARELYNCIAD